MIEPLGIDLVAFEMLDKYKSVKITIYINDYYKIIKIN